VEITNLREHFQVAFLASYEALVLRSEDCALNLCSLLLNRVRVRNEATILSIVASNATFLRSP